MSVKRFFRVQLVQQFDSLLRTFVQGTWRMVARHFDGTLSLDKTPRFLCSLRLLESSGSGIEPRAEECQRGCPCPTFGEAAVSTSKEFSTAFEPSPRHDLVVQKRPRKGQEIGSALGCGSAIGIS